MLGETITKTGRCIASLCCISLYRTMLQMKQGGQGKCKSNKGNIGTKKKRNVRITREIQGKRGEYNEMKGRQ